MKALKNLAISAFFAGALMGSALAQAQGPYRWRPAPFGGGGFVDGFVFHPMAKGLLYARTDIGGCYRWDGANRHWIGINDDLDRNETNALGCLSLALDPQDPDRVYVAAGEYTGPWAPMAKLLRSHDRGETWDRLALPFKLGGNEDGRSTGERLQVDPHKSDILVLASSKDGLWRSRDFGQTWRKVESLPVASPSFVLFDPASGAAGAATPILYAGAIRPHGPSLYVSRDGAATWAPIPGAPQGLTAHHAAFDTSGELYVTFGDGPGPNGVKTGAVWKRDPDGAWHDITPAQPTADVPFGYGGLGVDQQRPGVLVAATLDRWRPGDDLYRSTDGGSHWTALGPISRQTSSNAPWFAHYAGGRRGMGHWIGALAIDPFDGNDVIYGTGYGLWRSGDLTKADTGGEVDWAFAVDGLEETVPLAIASPPQGPRLLAAVGDVAGLAYANFDVSPSDGFFLPNTATNPDVTFAPRAPLKLARTSDAGPTSAFLSGDGGATWTPIPAAAAVRQGPDGRNRTAGHLAVSALGGFMVWARERQGAFASNDGGRRWAAVKMWPSDADQTLVPIADSTQEGVFYVSDPGRGQIAMSVDGGFSFEPIAHGLPAGGHGLRAAPDRLRDLWLPTPSGLWRSADASQPFHAVKGVEAADAIGFGKAAPGRPYPAVYLAGEVGGVAGIFRSDDEGENWVRISDDQHQFARLGAVTGDPRVYGRVYLQTSGRGVMIGEPAS